jgi:hypothetical protein
MEDESLTLSELKERGWTDSIIKKMNLFPDKLAKNPHYLKAAPMKLYFISRIEELEKSEQFSNLIQYFTNWIDKSFSFIPISKYFSVKCLKS